MCEVTYKQCTAKPVTTTPMFMGTIKVCASCAKELATPAEADGAVDVIHTDDYVEVKDVAPLALVRRVLDGGECLVEWSYGVLVNGVERLVEGRGVFARERLQLL